jgi:hypothetical protein
MEGNTGPTLDSHRLITFAARHNKYVRGARCCRGLGRELQSTASLAPNKVCDGDWDEGSHAGRTS